MHRHRRLRPAVERQRRQRLLSLPDGHEPDFPVYYILNRQIRDADRILYALRLTPVDTAIVDDWLDMDFMAQLCQTIVMAEKGSTDAVRETLQRPVLILGEAEFLDAVYADGHRESLAFQA